MKTRALESWVTLACLGTLLALLTGAGAQAPLRVHAVYRPEGVPAGPEAAAWRKAPEARIPLSPQIILPPNGGGSVAEVAVRAIHDGRRLAIRLEWKDDTEDRRVGTDVFRDAAAVGFPLGGSEPPPSPFMGDAAHPIGIWQWTADREAAARGAESFEERYPHTQGVWYFPQDEAVKREVTAWRRLDPVVEFVAAGFGTLTPRASHDVRARSRRGKDRWQLVLRRRLATGEARDVAFVPGGTSRLVVAVWNGGRGEVDGRKSVTLAWTSFSLDPIGASRALR